MKIIIFGGDGQVGSLLHLVLKQDYNVIFFNRESVNFCDSALLLSTMTFVKPDCIINCAAYTNVDNAELERDQALRINSEAVKEIADFCYGNNVLLIHFSTDYVFDGEKNGSYCELNEPNPINFYGETKLAGEKHILDSGCLHFIFRLSWVVSSSHKCFLSSIYQLAHTHEEIRVVDDQFGAPTSNRFIASVIQKVLLNYKTMKSGIYHLSCDGKTSWFNYACFIIDSIRNHRNQQKLVCQNIIPVSSIDYGAKAIRPSNSLLNCDKLFSLLSDKRICWKIDSSKELNRLMEN